MGRFRKKPVVIEAFRWTGGDNQEEDPPWMVHAIQEKVVTFELATVFGEDALIGLFVETKEGRMHASPGDWIIRGVMGELYPCKPDIFEATYEKVEGL